VYRSNGDDLCAFAGLRDHSYEVLHNAIAAVKDDCERVVELVIALFAAVLEAQTAIIPKELVGITYKKPIAG